MEIPYNELNPEYGYLQQGDEAIAEEERNNPVPFEERVRRQWEEHQACSS